MADSKVTTRGIKLRGLVYGLVLVAAGSAALLLNLSADGGQVRGQAGNPYELSGWLYGQNYGWISLNSGNCPEADGLCCGVACGAAYSVMISSSSDDIHGWAWSPNVGWICFGDGNAYPDSGCTGTPPSGSLGASFASSTGRLSGWAKVISMDDEGWIHLGSTSATSTPGHYLPACYNCTKSTTTIESCATCFASTVFDGETIPGDVDSFVMGAGKVCSDCRSCQKIDSIDGQSSRVECSNDCSGGCQAYGSLVDSDSGNLVGWIWNGSYDSENVLHGGGWLRFYNGSGLLAPWLETKYAPVFTQKSIRQWAASGNANASYCIYAQSLYGIRSASLSCPTYPVSDVNLAYPTSSSTQNVYRNSLGKIDVFGLSTSTRSAGVVQYNKYGNRIYDASALSGAVTLDNGVWVSNGNLTISGLTINNGSTYGNGTVVVNGDLIINGNVNYQTASGVSDLKKLASVAWIVKGDVIVSGSVTSLAGAFIVLGENGVTCRFDDGSICTVGVDYPQYQQNGYGVFFSGSSASQLTVRGVIAAKAYDFRRVYASSAQGSERILYDGRLMANTPPGLRSFSEGLPLVRDFQY